MTQGHTSTAILARIREDLDRVMRAMNSGGRVPPGAVLAYAGTTPPLGYLLLTPGATASREDYAVLFSVIGTTYGDGDGSTTFGLPPALSESIGSMIKT